MTSIPPVTATTDSRYMGYFNAPGGWSMAACVQSGEYYTESGSYFGCGQLATACAATSGGCTASGFSCITQRMHYTSPDPYNIGTKIKPACVAGAWSAYDLYRTLPSSSTPTSSAPSSTLTPSASPALPSPTSSSTSSSISTPGPSPAKSVSTGVIAGATIAGVAFLAVIAFLVWFFGFHRRKAAAQHAQLSHVQHDPAPTWQQPQSAQVHEIDGKGATVSEGYKYGYAPVSQGQQGNWAHQNTHDVGELAADPRRSN